MKYEETFTESTVDVVGFIKKAVPSTFASTLKESGVNFEIPTDRDLEFKVKYDEEGSCSIKVTWDTVLEEEEEEEEEDKEED